MKKTLPIKSLRLDFQPPENLIDFVVDEYAEKMARKEPIEPVTVRYDGEDYFLQDGFHRVAAALKHGRRMEAEFKKAAEAARESLRAESNATKPK
jgi:uncharacterized ParB-like nuclease family protein